MEEKYESVRHMISGKPHHHSRSPSSSQPATFDVCPARGSATNLDPRALTERLGRPGRPRASSKGSKHSSCTRCEPIVMHGWTLTAPVGFREVCRAIREEAFATNPLPIIISLEVHADMEQQEVMVDIMKEEWEGLLLERPYNTCDPNTRQPRLEELLNKILIKVKRPPAKVSVANGKPSLAPATSHDDDASGSEDERVAPEHRRKKKVPICDSLSALAIYTHSEHFKTFESAAARSPSHIFSINETRILELHATKHQEMFEHNRDFFMRAFPRGMRVDSSNPDPSLFWRKGVQMVAMNWQSWDEGMMLNSGMFAGEKGWVLKPAGYRSCDGAPVAHKTLDLRITIYAGQHIPLPEARQKSEGGQVVVSGAHDRSFRPHVKCELHVERREERPGEKTEGDGKSRYRQKTRARETRYPDFGKTGVTLEFLNIPKVVEELSFVRFKVEDEASYRDVLAAWACVRLDRLRRGYRFIELLDARGNPTDGKLFVKIEKMAG